MMIHRRGAEIAEDRIFSFVVERAANEKLLSRFAAISIP
jgi:hypothetical protein